MGVLKHVIEADGQTMTISNDALKTLYFEIGELLGYPNSTACDTPPPDIVSKNDALKPAKPIDPKFAALIAKPPRVKAEVYSVDFVLTAGKHFKRPVTAREMAIEMANAGWTTEAKDARTIVANARKAMKEAGYSSVGDGFWNILTNDKPDHQEALSLISSLRSKDDNGGSTRPEIDDED